MRSPMLSQRQSLAARSQATRKPLDDVERMLFQGPTNELKEVEESPSNFQESPSWPPSRQSPTESPLVFPDKSKSASRKSPHVLQRKSKRASIESPAKSKHTTSPSPDTLQNTEDMDDYLLPDEEEFNVTTRIKPLTPRPVVRKLRRR